MNISNQSTLSAGDLFKQYVNNNSFVGHGDLEQYSRNFQDTATTQDIQQTSPADYGPIDWAKDTYHSLMATIS